MKVLHCIPSIDSSYGGPATVVRGLCSGLRGRGIQADILTCSSGDVGLDERNAAAVPGAGVLWSHPLLRRFYWDPMLSARWGKEVAAYDILHVHGLFSGLTAWACAQARRHGIPYVLQPSGTLSPWCLVKSRRRKEIALALFERRNIEAASALVFTSAGERQRASLNFRWRDSFVLANGVDLNEFAELPRRGQMRSRLGLDEQETVLLFLGRLQPIKGLESFVPDFLDWRQERGINWRLVLAGPNEGGYLGCLQKMLSAVEAGDSVLLAGPLYGRERLEAFSDADMVVLPSWHENFGLAAAEGLACGRPVLVSSGVDIAPSVEEHGLGVVTELNHDGNKAALDRALACRDDWPAMGERGRRWVEVNCDPGRICSLLAGRYADILGKKKPSSCRAKDVYDHEGA